MWLLPLLFTAVSAARYRIYHDDTCVLPIANVPDVLAFTDVCTWSSNRYSGAFSVALYNCSSSEMVVIGYNASSTPTCQGVPNYIIPVTSECTKYQDFYVKGYDFTCESQNTTYNILAHFQADCNDGGLPFSIQLGEGTCQAGSFAPGFFNWDTEGEYSAPYYEMKLYNTTNGTCQDERAIFQTESFPAECVKSNTGFQGISVDIYQAFPVSP